MLTPPLAGFPEAQFAPNGDLQIAFYEVRPDLRGTMPPVVFCHGFPECGATWRAQLSAMEAAGRWAIALDMRGFGLTGGPGTGGPSGVEEYDIVHLTGDLVAVLDHIGAETAIWCGHDWGGAVVWHMPLLHAARTEAVIVLNTPWHPPGPIDPLDMLRAQYGDTLYMLVFQPTGVADTILNRDPATTIKFFLRRDHQEAGINRGCGGGWNLHALPLVDMLDAYDPEQDERPVVLDPQELAYFAALYKRTGFTGGINLYRNLSRNWRLAADFPRTIAVPSLMIVAENDPVLPPVVAEGMEEHIPGLEKRMIHGSGHWTQHEKPFETNALILDWLDRRFALR